jgi:hypothetical protein
MTKHSNHADWSAKYLANVWQGFGASRKVRRYRA